MADSLCKHADVWDLHFIEEQKTVIHGTVTNLAKSRRRKRLITCIQISDQYLRHAHSQAAREFSDLSPAPQKDVDRNPFRR
jgi:hypothetical protein